jgi:hypothetical protein
MVSDHKHAKGLYKTIFSYVTNVATMQNNVVISDEWESVPVEIMHKNGLLNHMTLTSVL